ncbi:MAG: non-canonical purine NTP pyrophosphatase [bacterium]|nr:non-canonical purine NTP pyrophosphatase [bacterium]
MKLLIATSNEGKLREYRHLLRKMPFELAGLKDLGIKEHPEETGTTLEENALLKARFYQKKAGIPVLADDTGLEIDALNGEPGIHARRWPGYEATDQELVDYTLKRMKGIPLEQRGARFRAVLAVAKGEKDVRLFEGSLTGYITEEAHYPIVKGYPYRSLFFAPAVGMVLAEAEIEELENLHRREAVEKAREFLSMLAGSKV